MALGFPTNVGVETPCRQCGRCCRRYAIAMHRNEDFARFLVYHGLVLRERPDGEMEVYGESKCVHLKTDPKHTTRTVCDIYETRPNLCRGWVCTED
jgi:Fe-S-cluster containining protein